LSEDALLREIYDYIVKNCGRVRGSPYTEESKARALARMLATRIRRLQEKHPDLDIVEAATSKLDEIIVCTDDPGTILSNFELFVKAGFGIDASPGELVEDRIRELMAEREELASRIRELEELPSEELPYWYVDGEPVGTEERRRRILEQWRRELEEYDRLINEISEQKAKRRWSPIEAYTREAEKLKKRFEKLQGEISEVFRNFEKKWSEVKPYYERAEQLLKDFEAGRTEPLEREGEAVLSKLRQWLISYSTLEYDLERDLSRLNTEREFLLTDVRILRDKIVRRKLKKITPESLSLTEMEKSLSIGAVSGSLGILEDYIKKVKRVKEYVSSLESAVKKLKEKKEMAKPPAPPPPSPKPPPAIKPLVPPPPPPEEMRVVMKKRRAFEEYLRTRVPRIYRVDWSGFYTARISYHAEVEEALKRAVEETGARVTRIVEAKPPLKVMYADFTPAKIPVAPPAPAPPPTPPTRPKVLLPVVEAEEKWRRIVEDARKLVEEWIKLYVPTPKAPAVRAALNRALGEVESDVKELLRAGRPEMAEEEVNRVLREVAEVVVSINPKAREHPRIKALIPEKPPAPSPVAIPPMEEIPWWMPGKPAGVGWPTWKWAKYFAKLESLMRATYERTKYPTIPPLLRGHPNPWVEQFPPLVESKDNTVELHPTTMAGLVRIAERAGVKLTVQTEWSKRELLGLIDSLYRSPKLGSHEREWLDLLGKAVRGEL